MKRVIKCHYETVELLKIFKISLKHRVFNERNNFILFKITLQENSSTKSCPSYLINSEI